MPLAISAVISKVFEAILGPVIKAVWGIFKSEKLERDAEKGRSLEKAAETVGESLEVEKEIRDKQDEVDKPGNKSDVTADDGAGLNFDDFNSGK